jgi:hypothetical protein
LKIFQQDSFSFVEQEEFPPKKNSKNMSAVRAIIIAVILTPLF